MSSFCKCKSYSYFFSKNISVYSVLNDQSFNNTLTEDIVSFEQLGPNQVFVYSHRYSTVVNDSIHGTCPHMPDGSFRDEKRFSEKTENSEHLLAKLPNLNRSD